MQNARQELEGRAHGKQQQLDALRAEIPRPVSPSSVEQAARIDLPGKQLQANRSSERYQEENDFPVRQLCQCAHTPPISANFRWAPAPKRFSSIANDP